MRRGLSGGLGMAAALLATPAWAQAEPVSARTPAAPAQAPAPAPSCAAERAALLAEQAALRAAIADIALGVKPKKKVRVGAGDVGRAAAGTAASILLPFGVGALLGAGLDAATKKKRRAAPAAAPGPDPNALIARQRAVGERLAALDCAAPAAPASPAP